MKRSTSLNVVVSPYASYTIAPNEPYTSRTHYAQICKYMPYSMHPSLNSLKNRGFTCKTNTLTYID